MGQLTLGCLIAALLAWQTPTFKSRVTHVTLDVVVTDKDDRPVTGLTADDFEIIVQGKTQVIADFERISIPLGGRAIESLKDIPRPPTDTFTNAAPPHTGRAFAIWLDDIDLSNIIPTKRVLTEFVRSLSADDRVAVTFGRRSDIAQDFTRDPALLMRIFDRLGEGLLAKQEGQYETMRNLVNNLSDAAELRRAVIVVTESFPMLIPNSEFLEQVERARRAGIPVYLIDPSGVHAPPLMLDGLMEDQTAENRMRKQQADFASQQNMRNVPEYSGGRPFVGIGDVVKAARELIEDTSTYYLLGFYPQPYDADGKFHEVEVRTKRKDLKVRARLGYTAADARKPERPASLTSTLGAGLPGGDLEMHAFAAPVAPGSKGVSTWVTADVQYPAVLDGAKRDDDVVEVSWIAIDPDARVRARGQRSVRVPLGNAPSQAFTLMLNDVIDLPRGALTVRIAAASRTIGTRGTVHVPVSVPSVDGRKIESTPLVIGAEAAGPTRMVMLTTEKAVLPFQPSTRRRFAQGAELRVWSRVFARDAATAALTVKRGDEVVRTLTMKTSAATRIKSATDCGASVSLAGLAPGDYVLEFVARAGSSETRRAVPFEIR